MMSNTTLHPATSNGKKAQVIGVWSTRYLANSVQNCCFHQHSSPPGSVDKSSLLTSVPEFA